MLVFLLTQRPSTIPVWLRLLIASEQSQTIGICNSVLMLAAPPLSPVAAIRLLIGFHSRQTHVRMEGKRLFFCCSRMLCVCVCVVCVETSPPATYATRLKLSRKWIDSTHAKHTQKSKRETTKKCVKSFYILSIEGLATEQNPIRESLPLHSCTHKMHMQSTLNQSNLRNFSNGVFCVCGSNQLYRLDRSVCRIPYNTRCRSPAAWHTVNRRFSC